jgi:adenylyl-sulfate kinase
MTDASKSPNVVPQKTAVSRDDRARALSMGSRQRGVVLWFTGLSGSGKSTIASEVERRLNAAGRLTYLLDGDNVRHGLNGDLGFSDADRVENIRRVSHMAKLFWDASVITLVSFISPFRTERGQARDLIGPDFVEVFVDAPLELCEKRDVKGLYKKARVGEIPAFTGISSPYEAPEHPEIHLKTGEETLEADVEKVLGWLREKEYFLG